MADKKKSLSDLGALTSETPETPTPSVEATETTVAEAGETETVEAPAPVNVQPEAPLREQQLDKYGRAYATGRRKDAVARVWLKPGSGKIEINGRDQAIYFARATLRLVINQPFGVTEREGQYDVVATVKRAGFLTRDPRVVERKKYGKAKARRSFQFSKR